MSSHPEVVVCIKTTLIVQFIAVQVDFRAFKNFRAV